VISELKQTRYDLVLDAQGLLKSAIWGRFVNAPIAGLNADSAREPLANWLYHRSYTVAWGQHAIDRLRLLFAQALDYPCPDLSQVDYALSLTHPMPQTGQAPYWFFAHATTWESKHWPEAYWHQLVGYAGKQGRQVWLSWHNEEEEARVQRLARLRLNVRVLPPSNLATLAGVLAGAEFVVGVDTGLTHLAAALHRPVIALYGATEAGLTGVIGPAARVLQSEYVCSPCLREQCIELSSTQETPPCYHQNLSAHHVMQQIAQMLHLPEPIPPTESRKVTWLTHSSS
jgi:heptosyltransferase-1